MSVWIKNPQEKVRKNSLTKSRPDWCVVNCIFRLFGLLSIHSVITSVAGGRVCRNACFCSNIFGAFYLFFPFFSFSPLP